MFLSELQKEEKEAFLELASLIAIVDGNLSVYEKSIFDRYKKETGLENYKVKGLRLEEILKKFKNEQSKNIVLAEILQLIYSDGVFHDSERESIQIIKEYFGFDPQEYGNFKAWVSKIKELSNSLDYD